MSQTIDVNGQSINYPETGDTNWGDEATDFAVQTSAALGKLGLASGTSVDIAQTLDVTGNTTLDANLSVGGNTTITGNITVNGNSNLGNGTSDTTAITGILNIDSGVLYVDPTNNRVGINDTTPSEALDVTGNALISGTLGVTGATSLSSTLGVTGDVAVNTNKFNVTASSGNTLIAGTLGVTGAGSFTSNITSGGVIYADDDTTANTPVLSFTGDTNTGIGRSASDTLDFITNGASRLRIEPTGQIKAVYESQVGTDYNITLHNGYFCRAWVNFDGTAVVSPASATGIRASGNVSSITDNGTGNYNINFTIDMPDVNYAVCTNSGSTTTASFNTGYLFSSSSESTCQIRSANATETALEDKSVISVAVFR